MIMPIAVAMIVIAGNTTAAVRRRRRAVHSGRTVFSSETSAEPMKTAIAKPIKTKPQFIAVAASREPPVRQSIGQRMEQPVLDCLIVGGGPAGLTAAIYLSRYHLDILVVDGGKSRASW